MTDKIRNLLEDVQTVYEGKGMVVHPNSFDKLRMEVIKLDNINKQQSEQIEKMKCLLNELYSEFGFSELVKVRNDLPIEIQEVIKEIKEND